MCLRRGFGWPFLALAVLLWSSVPVFMMLGTVQAAWVVCFTLGAAIPQFAEMHSSWLRHASHLIARYSYGIYLTHYFFILLAFVKLQSLPRVCQCLVFVATVWLVPVFLYHLLWLS